jgi:ADP-ribose pyrophosphatase YjhB (NUDIX family)
MSDYELFEVSAKAILLNEGRNKMLLCKHKDGSPSIPGGHLEAGESMIDALGRELKEELGIDYNSSKLKLVAAQKYYRKSSNVGKVDLYYLGELSENTEIIGNTSADDIIDWEWVSVEEILTGKTEKYITVLLEEILEEEK